MKLMGSVVGEKAPVARHLPPVARSRGVSGLLALTLRSMCRILPRAWVVALLLIGCNALFGQFSDTSYVFCEGCPFPKFIEWDDQPGSDLLIVGNDSLFVSVNDGTGSFLPPFAFTAIPPGSKVVLAEDIDDDEDLDFAIQRADTCWVLRREGGLFEEVLLDTGMTGDLEDTVVFQRRGIFSSYFDEDELKDLQFKEMSETSFTWYRNNGTGGYEKQIIPLWGSSNYGDLVAFDWDGDGDNDLIAPGINMSPKINGTWGHPWVTVANDQFDTSGMVVVDMDQDGDVDLLGGASIFLRSAGGSLEQICCMTSSGTNFRWVGDLNCIPGNEVFNWNPTAGNVNLIVSVPNGSTINNDPPDLQFTSPFLGPSSILYMHFALADVDGDDKIDAIYKAILAFNVPTDRVFVALNTTGEVEVTLDIPFTTLPTDTVVELSGGSPPGGMYIGDGVYGNILYTDLAGEGPVEITYIYEDEFGCGGRAVDVIDIAIGMNEDDLSIETLLVYPNPSVGRITLVERVASEQLVRIFDPLGKEVLASLVLHPLETRVIDLTMLAPGQYVMEHHVRATGGVSRSLLLLQ